MDTIEIPDKDISADNDITQDDIDAHKIRITKKFMSFFPYENTVLEIVICDTSYECALDLNNKDGKQRSYNIILGKEAMKNLGLKAYGKILITKLDEKKYEIQLKPENSEKQKDQEEFKKKFFGR